MLAGLRAPPNKVELFKIGRGAYYLSGGITMQQMIGIGLAWECIVSGKKR
jgi:hypothetical protein